MVMNLSTLKRESKVKSSTTVRLWPDPSELEGISEHQREQAIKAMRGPVGMVSGEPGAGKTRLTAAILKAVAKQHGSEAIAVAAPTGKAGVRLTEVMLGYRLDVEATTCHRMLGVSRNGHDGAGWGFLHNDRCPLSKKVVVIDEASMLDSSLFANVLSALRNGTHLLLVGDFYQLPPVGHGAPLRDMLAAGLPFGELTEIHRNGGDLIEVCRAIKRGEKYRPSTHFDPANGRNVIHREARRSGDVLNELVGLITECPKQYDRVWDVQVLTAINEESALSRKELNKLLQKLLNPEGAEIPGQPMRMGDKVICTSNGWLPEVRCTSCGGRELVDEERGYECQKCGDQIKVSDMSEDFVANGEMGKVVGLTARHLHVAFEAPRRTVRIAGENRSKFDLGYAITVHKSQGSQWKAVVMIADDSRSAARVMSREGVYTGLSRMEDAVFTIGKQATLDLWCGRSALAERKTFLQEMLRLGQAA